MTSYNRERYIAAAIESVLQSSFTDFEFIIVDDASSDSTSTIIQRYALQDKRIRFYHNEKNLGDYPNRNKAASLARGKYIKFVDSDDYIYPCGLEILVKAMEQFPAAGWGICSLKPDIEKPFPFVLHPKAAYEYHFFGPGLFHKGPLTVIMKKEFFDRENGFDNGRMISDTDMWYRLGLQYPVVLLGEGIVWQRLHDQQELNEAYRFVVEGSKIQWKYLLNPQCPLTVQQLQKIKDQRVKRYRNFILSGIKRFSARQVKTYLACLHFVKNINLKLRQ